MNPIYPIKSNQRVFVHGGVATPKLLLKALTESYEKLENVEIIHLHTEAMCDYADKKYARSFKVVNLFVGSNMRDKLDYDRVDYLPCFLSEIPSLFRSGLRRPNVALIQVSPPNAQGFVTLGTSVDVTKAAVDNADIVIAEINKQMPTVHGDGYLHISRLHSYIEVDYPLPAHKRATLTSTELAIGKNVASIVEDGSCLQLGIGTIPDAVASCLTQHKHLGVHTEMWSDGVLDLIKCGAVDNSQKLTHPGKTVSSFLMGSKDVYDFIHDNPSVILLPAEYVNDPRNILRNPKVVAVNSAVEIDLTGQICADSVGTRIISGVGGQMDFIRGAALSNGGKPIFAISSRSAKGKPKLVAKLQPGAGVVSTRSHVHWVVTEFGVVNLFGKTLKERAESLISIAHPDDRENLAREWHQR